MIADMPVAFIQTGLFGSLVFWIVGLNSSAGDKYIYFMMICFLYVVHYLHNVVYLLTPDIHNFNFF